jgi:hypothetical protein
MRAHRTPRADSTAESRETALKLSRACARRPDALSHVIALMVFAALSLWYFWRGDINGKYFGLDTDPTAYIWFLNWWPSALAHRLNPFLSYYVWYPHGFNMTWAASLPLPALFLTPITRWFGPVVTFNLLSLSAPALSAWTAYLLAQQILQGPAWKNGNSQAAQLNALGRFFSALLAGYLFGFSSYELAHLLGHLNLVLTFLLPLLLLLVLKRLQGELPRKAFVLLLAVCLAAQLGLATEILATLCFFGGIAWLLFYRFAGPVERHQLRNLASEMGLGLALMILLTAPFLFYVFRDLAEVKHQLNDPNVYSTDLANYVVPTAVSQFGHSMFAPLSEKFTGNLFEQAGYLGWPLLVLFALYFWQTRGQKQAKPLGLFLLLLLVFSLGPTLHLGAISTGIWLPWILALPLPFIHQALPARFTLYITLLASVIVALWLSKSGRFWSARFGLAGLACLSLLPNGTLPRWTPLPVQPFFEPQNIRAVLGNNPNVVMLPYGWKGPSMFWQLQSGMGFTQSGGYLGTVPESEAALPIVSSFYNGTAGPDFPRNLREFCRTHRVNAILLGPGTPAVLTEAIRALNWSNEVHQGIRVFRVPAGESHTSGAEK